MASRFTIASSSASVAAPHRPLPYRATPRKLLHRLPLVLTCAALTILALAACDDEEEDTQDAECPGAAHCPPPGQPGGPGATGGGTFNPPGTAPGPGTPQPTAGGSPGAATQPGASGGGGATGGAPASSAPAPTTARFCQEACTADTDCLDGFSCRDARCTSDAAASCTGPTECVVLFSGWQETCTADEDCGGPDPATRMRACVTHAGENICAYLGDNFIDSDYCPRLNMEDVPLPRADGSGTVVVCGQPRARCRDEGWCELPCTGPESCMAAEYPTCDATAGRCVCNAQSCGTGQACRSDGFCGCTSDEACIAGPGTQDRCWIASGESAGFCGCSSVAACGTDTAHPGTTLVCEAVR